jgi:ABC-type multidrug transport system fused ATPase/permease subunit
MAASWSLYQVLGWNEDLLTIASACNVLDAVEDLRTALADRGDHHGASSALASAAASEPNITPPCTVPMVRFEEVSFSYPGTGTQILDRLNFEIRPGELVAIVGLNGAGKSTLIKLLCSLYKPTSGRITADGLDTSDPRLPAWRSQISVVFQDFIKYQFSAMDNIVLGRADIPVDYEALEFAKAEAGIDRMIGSLADGWNTPLSVSRTGGVDLSGGQWQKIVLARALYAIRLGAKLLVLDEPTAHLDVRSEFDVFQRLAKYRGAVSLVLISHRLSTVRYADRILLLEDGRITESGTHEALIESNGKYARLFSIQAERFNQGHQDRFDEGELR